MKEICSTISMVLTADYVTAALTPLWGLFLGGTAAPIVLILLFYALRVLETEDHDRLSLIVGALPRQLSALAIRLISALTRAENSSMQKV